MPSIAAGSATATLQSLTNSTFGANTLNSLLEAPLHFEKSTLPTTSGISGRYTPLNTPIQSGNGATDGLGDGKQAAGESMSDETESSEDTDANDSRHINGDSHTGSKPKNALSTEWLRPQSRPPGLTNFGNTCYMNSTLQALMHIPPLVTFCLKRKHEATCTKGPSTCIFCHLERHVQDIYPLTMQRKSFIDPVGFVGKHGLLQKFPTAWRQEDSHEFLIHLLDKMDDAEKRSHKNPKFKSIVQEIFGGECRQSITCQRDDCRHVSHTSQLFMDLSLDLLPRERDIASSLADFTKQEILSQDNLYKCEKCNGKSRAKKITKIHKVPPVLTIHLKRFAASGLRKNSTQIHYPEELDLNPYLSEESKGVPKYRLVATVCHHSMGIDGMRSGHYTANCKSASGTWNHFDDTSTMGIKAKDVLLDRDAYILFYARDDRRSGSTPSGDKGRSTNSLSSQLLAKKPVNGFIGPELPSASKQKRPLDEDHETESPSKRLRLSDDENDSPKPHAKSEKIREPLKTVTNGDLSSASPQRPQVSGQSRGKPSQLRNFERPKQTSNIPASYLPNKTATSHLGATSLHFRGDPATSQRSGKPIHRINPLQTTSSNPYVDSDPFAAGVLLGQQRQSEKQKSQARPKFPGIGSQLTPGSNQAFLDHKTLSRRNDLGIQIDKNRSRK